MTRRDRIYVVGCALVVLGMIVAVAKVYSDGEDDERARELERARERKREAEEARKNAPPPAPPPPEREPTFVAESADSSVYASEKERTAGTELESIAMRTVFARCSHLPAWRGGPSLRGTLVWKGKSKVERVNVGVELVDKEQRAQGHTLWYMVTFDAKKAPAMIQAKKEISAILCGLVEPDVDYPL